MKQVTLTIGTKSKRQLLKSLKGTVWVRELLATLDIQKSKRVLNLEILTVSELGFVGIATRGQIYDKAHEMGLELCPADVAFYLREPDGAFLAMEPIIDEHGCPRILQSASDRLNDDDYLVHAPSGYPELSWGDFYRWIFVRPKGDA